MPYANNQGIRIYYEVEGEGPPLVLHHGVGWSQILWRIAGWTEQLKGDYQLILMDARGHGASDKPHDPQAYKMATRVADVAAVLDDLGIDQAHFLGYSMGGEVGWGIAVLAPKRFRSLVLGGMSSYSGLSEGLDLLALFQQGMEASLAAGEALFGPRWTPEVKAMFSANDMQALVALLSVREDQGIEYPLPAISTPCLLFGGENDPWYAGAEQRANSMPNATCVVLPGFHHTEPFYRLDLVLPHIRTFLAEASSSG